MLQFFLAFSMIAIAIFLILLILVQRGRGGGLTGALGGMGGQSAFGVKAGDVFTKITMVTAVVWILVCMLSIKLIKPVDQLGDERGSAATETLQSTDKKDDGATLPGVIDDKKDAGKADDKKAETPTTTEDKKGEVTPPATATEGKTDDKKAEATPEAAPAVTPPAEAKPEEKPAEAPKVEEKPAEAPKAEEKPAEAPKAEDKKE